MKTEYGNHLHPDDQKRVLDAYIYRMTPESVARWPDVATGMRRGGYALPLISDAEWLATSKFVIKSNRRLDARYKACETFDQVALRKSKVPAPRVSPLPPEPEPEPAPPYDVTGNVIAYESGELDEEGVTVLFQHLVNSGLAWQLQGSYGRTAEALIDAGFIERAAKSAV